MAIVINSLIGSEILGYLSELAGLRIEIFREYPYLYDGDPQYEAHYLRTYSQSPDSVFVLAQDADKIVGISTGLPLADADPQFARPFIDKGYDPGTIFYFGESVLLSPYRGQGIGGRFFEQRERHAIRLNRFQYTTFCAVERAENHPARPAHYKPLDAFWERRGYRRYPDMQTVYPWRDLGDDRETAKPMVFWLKPLLSTPPAAP